MKTVRAEIRTSHTPAEEITVIERREYRDAFLKSMMDKELSEREERMLTTANSGGNAIPKVTMNRVIDKMRQTSALFDHISVSYIPGNVSFIVADAKNAAAWKQEGSEATPADDTIKQVQLNGHELIKLVEITASMQSMGIEAFEQYLVEELSKQMAIAIEKAILYGNGTDQPTGILEGVTFTNGVNRIEYTGSVSYDDLMQMFSLLPTLYHERSKIMMNSYTLYRHVRKIKGSDGTPIFAYNAQDEAALSILGYEILLNDHMDNNTIVFGDFSKYVMNFPQQPSLDVSKESEFKSGKVVYRSLAVADGKPALDEAFVLVTEE